MTEEIIDFLSEIEDILNSDITSIEIHGKDSELVIKVSSQNETLEFTRVLTQ